MFVVSLITAVLTLWVTYFFRDPVRTCPSQPGILVAPADGRIVAIDTLPTNSHIEGPAVKVSIFLSVFDVHVNRVPTLGTIDYVTYNPGKFMPAYRDKASLDNEQTEIGMTSAGGHRLVFKQIAGIIARRIVCHLSAGDRVETGEKFGMIRFGSRADLIMPADCEVSVRLGDHVAGGVSVLGRLPQTAVSASERRETQGSDVEL